MRRNWIIALGLFALVIGGIIALMNERNGIESSLKRTLAQSIANPDVELSGATFKEIVGGVTYWELHAKKSDVNEDVQTAKLGGARGTFFEKGEPTLRFISPSAIWNRGDGTIRMDDILGYTLAFEEAIQSRKTNASSSFFFSSADSPTQGAWFHADSLLWSVEKQKLVCERMVKLHQGNVHIRAKKLESDVGLRKVELTGKPEAWISETKITADRFVLHRLEYTLDADGPVEIREGRAKATAEHLQFNEETQIISLIGDVRFGMDETTAGSAKAYYSVEKELLTFVGDPKVTQKGNTVTGKRISVSLKDRSVHVEGSGRAIIEEEALPHADR